MDYFNYVLATFLDLDHGASLAVYWSVRKLLEFIKMIKKMFDTSNYISNVTMLILDTNKSILSS